MKPNVKKSESSEEYTLEEEALIRQWLEYRKVVLDRYHVNSHQSSGLPVSVFQVIELNVMIV
jgi:hypothetical protein